MVAEASEKIRVRLESFNHELLDFSCQKIINLAQKNDLIDVRSIVLPTDRRIYCVLRSPHVDKDSREHFESRIHKRILDIDYGSGINIFDLLSKSNLPTGVLYRICLL